MRRKKNEVAFMDDDRVIWIRLDHIPGFIEMFKKAEIKCHKLTCKEYLQQLLDEGKDVDIRGTKKGWEYDRKNISLVLDRLKRKFGELDGKLKQDAE